ncbi:MAG: lytic murein transglycosylase [bacterium]|nr:lytic murein transglycosylase [bacterium]
MRRWYLLIIFLICALLSPSALFAKTKQRPRGPVLTEAQTKKALEKFLTPSQGAARAKEILSDPRITLDPRVTGRGIKGGPPCDYFDPCFGLLSDASLDEGVAYRIQYQQYFDEAERLYGVPPEYILGILRVETKFGKRTGTWPVLRTLYSMYALIPRRRLFAAEQFAHFLKIADKNGLDLYETKGSIASAIGIPQFIPASWSRWAVDGDNDGRIDLFTPPDAIVSIANYFYVHGWGVTDQERKDAVYSYNHSHRYVAAVIAYAEEVKNR